MLVLSVAAFCSDQIPTIFFQKFDDVMDFHRHRIRLLALSRIGITCLYISKAVLIGLRHRAKIFLDLSNLYTTTTVLTNRPTPSISMATSSPAASVNSLGGTTPVPVSSTAPCGYSALRPR